MSHLLSMNNTILVSSQIPGPGFFSFIRNVRPNPVLYCYKLMKEYGDVVRCSSLQDIYLISNPAFAKEIFINSKRTLIKTISSITG